MESLTKPWGYITTTDSVVVPDTVAPGAVEARRKAKIEIITIEKSCLLPVVEGVVVVVALVVLGVVVVITIPVVVNYINK